MTRTVIKVAPKRNMKKKSADLFRKDPSSNILQYRYVKMRLNKNVNPNGPKNRKVVRSLHN